MREEIPHEIEVHVASIIFRKTNGIVEVLIAKRSPKRALYPSKWECGGGQVFAGESFQEALKRQVKEEFNCTITLVGILGPYEIESPTLPQKKISGIKFACIIESGEPQVASEEHTECRWITLDKLDDYDFIGTLKEDIQTGAALLA
jgi:8-oxo-dGTP diphosphatase